MPTMLLPLMLFDAEQLPHKSGHSIEMSGSAASTTRRAVSEASSEAEHADGLERHTEAAEQRTVGSCRRVAIMIRVEATLRRRRYSSSVFSVPERPATLPASWRRPRQSRSATPSCSSSTAPRLSP